MTSNAFFVPILALFVFSSNSYATSKNFLANEIAPIIDECGLEYNYRIGEDGKTGERVAITRFFFNPDLFPASTKLRGKTVALAIKPTCEANQSIDGKRIKITDFKADYESVDLVGYDVDQDTRLKIWNAIYDRDQKVKGRTWAKFEQILDLTDIGACNDINDFEVYVIPELYAGNLENYQGGINSVRDTCPQGPR